MAKTGSAGWVREGVWAFVPAVVLLGALSVQSQGQVSAGKSAEKGGWRNLPTSKELGAVPGNPQPTNALPTVMAVSPDGRWVVTVDAGYGTYESGYDQSLSVMDTRTGSVEDVPDDRTGLSSKETLFSGIAFSADGRRVYVSMASLTSPEGEAAGRTDREITGSRQRATSAVSPGPGSGIAVYGFAGGKLTAERFLPIALEPLAAGRKTGLDAGRPGMGVPYPAGIAVVPGSSGSGDRLLVADNLSDDALLLDAESGKLLTRFDLSESDAVPGTYPVGVAVSQDGTRGYVSLWNASEVVELNLARGTVGRKIPLFKPDDPVRPGSHPCALAFSPDGKTLYVALANRDAVASVDVSLRRFALRGYFDTRLPAQSYFGAEPDALAVSADGRRVYAANLAQDAVAVLETRQLSARTAKKGMAEPVGFLPTEWMPTAVAVEGDRLFVATAKGRGTGPNDFPQRIAADGEAPKKYRAFTYIPTLLHGSLAEVDLKTMDLKASTEAVLEANRMRAAQETIRFAVGGQRIRHVIYLIKENRTYDQIFGDLSQYGRPVGNGDPRLTMYGEAITPNEHKLALEFGVLDNFFDSAEVSGDGHVWSNAAIGTDYLEKTWPLNYRNGQRTYDFEGVVAEGYPLLQKIPDVAEPQSGYMWGNAERHGKTHYNFGEYIATTFCDVKASAGSQEGPVLEGARCASPTIQPGEAIPAEWGGAVNRWPWPIPRIASNVATKPELVGHFAQESPDFNLRVPDQIRAEVFLRHFAGWVQDRAAGHDTMPNYITMRLGNDHTAGTVPGGPTPKASVADNDLALGRIVEAVSHSAYWDDTAIIAVEDDAQNGADHVDAHRSLALVISKYAPHGTGGGAYVDSRFYTTVSLVRTMESLLGLPPMNNNDALAPLIAPEFAGHGDKAPFAADYRNRDNGLIYTANRPDAPGATQSMKMDFRHEDRADPRVLNAILWRDAKGDTPMPTQITRKSKEKSNDDDD